MSTHSGSSSRPLPPTQSNRDRYRDIFESTPLCLWEEDVTEMLAHLQKLRDGGVEDMRSYLMEHPAELGAAAAKVKILDMNSEAIRTYDAESKEQLLGSLDKLMPPEASTVFLELALAMLDGERHFKCEHPALTVKGKPIDVLLQAFVLDDTADPDRTIALVCILDISQRKSMEQELRDINVELHRSNRDLEQFAYVASHDLQEPLRIVNSYAKLFDQQFGLDKNPKARKYLEQIMSSTARMQSIINDLLSLSRIGSKKKPLQPVESAKVVREALSMLQIRIDESNARIITDKLPVVLADYSQLTLVFQNLIGNALKFRGEAPPVVHISAQRQGEKWVISVRDNGIGIDQQDQEAIFAIFKRVHSTREYPGTGIGLAIVKRIMEQHGGRVWVESEVGKGSTFFLAFHAAE